MARLLVREWPDDIHLALKLEAVRRGVSLREILLEAVKVWLKEGKAKK
jgi:plasmid stability protein